MEKARDAQYRELAERIERQTKLDTAARLLQTERLLQVCLMFLPCFFRVSVPGLATPAHRLARRRLGHIQELEAGKAARCVRTHASLSCARRHVLCAGDPAIHGHRAGGWCSGGDGRRVQEEEKVEDNGC